MFCSQLDIKLPAYGTGKACYFKDKFARTDLYKMGQVNKITALYNASLYKNKVGEKDIEMNYHAFPKLDNSLLYLTLTFFLALLL